MAPFGGLSLALRGWEVFQKQTDRCSDTQTDVRTHRRTDRQTNILSVTDRQGTNMLRKNSRYAKNFFICAPIWLNKVFLEFLGHGESVDVLRFEIHPEIKVLEVCTDRWKHICISIQILPFLFRIFFQNIKLMSFCQASFTQSRKKSKTIYIHIFLWIFLDGLCMWMCNAHISYVHVKKLLLFLSFFSSPNFSFFKFSFLTWT